MLHQWHECLCWSNYINEIMWLDYYSPTVHPKIHILIAIQKHNVAKPWKPFEGSKLLQGTPYRFHIRQHSFCAKKVTQVITVTWQWVTKQLRSLEFHIEEPFWNFGIISGPEMFLHLFQVLIISSCHAQVHSTSLSHCLPPKREHCILCRRIRRICASTDRKELKS